MRDDLIGAGATTSFAVSLSMALLAAVALANVSGSASTFSAVFAVLVAAVATVLSVLLMRFSISLLDARRKASSRKPVPVEIYIKDRKRARR